MDLLVAILVALVGLAALVVGYRLFRLLLPVWGFVVGFFAGAVVVCCAGWDSAPPVWAMAGTLKQSEHATASAARRRK